MKGMAWHGKERKDMPCQVKEMKGMTWKDKERHGMISEGNARHVLAWNVMEI
jgi:hypothetical protein